MSRTLGFGCDNCKVSLWIGQSVPDATGGRTFYIYTHAQPKLAEFLAAHAGHRLIAGDDEFLPTDWTELDDDPDDDPPP